MAPQFVDFDGDGHIDIVTATFDGSPHVARGGPDGFAQPEHFLDSSGRRILLDQFWNYDSKAWENADRGPEGGAEKGDQCISALVFDWDADGDLDLILGDYRKGRLYRQMNLGEPGAASFTGENVPIEVGGEEHSLEGGMTAPQLVDWDGDGLMDLLVGGFGDCWGEGAGGGVWLLRNVGAPGAPEFDEPLLILERSRNPRTELPLRPDAGLYASAVDYDGDGKLDLLVGGYSFWQPAQPVLSDEEIARADELEQRIARDDAALQKLRDRTLEGAEDVSAKFAELRESEEYKALVARLAADRAELDTLRPSAKREAAVWLYRRLE